MNDVHVIERINNYLSSGGLFNPELMEHDKVRDILIDCRNEIERLEAILINVKLAVETFEGYYE